MTERTYRILLLVYMGLILTVSSIPRDELPRVFLLTWDKLLHLVEYFLLGILAVKSLGNVTFKMVIIIVLGGLGFALIDEYLQSFITGRFSSGFDVLADTLGVSMGCLSVHVYNRVFSHD
ncbi:MAG: VanZ family protein [Fidelibacterota bacterium]